MAQNKLWFLIEDIIFDTFTKTEFNVSDNNDANSRYTISHLPKLNVFLRSKYKFYLFIENLHIITQKSLMTFIYYFHNRCYDFNVLK